MSYQLFLETLNQLSSKGSAAIAHEKGMIYLQSMQEKNKWRISIPLIRGNKEIPAYLSQCVSSLGTLYWQKAGAYLQLDASSQTVSLIDEIEIVKDKYLSFKKTMSALIELSQEWKDILCSFEK